MLERRLQILLDSERHERLLLLAAERHVSVARIVRDAIDRQLAGSEGARRSALVRLLAAEPMDVPAPGDLREELERLRSRRG